MYSLVVFLVVLVRRGIMLNEGIGIYYYIINIYSYCVL